MDSNIGMQRISLKRSLSKTFWLSVLLHLLLLASFSTIIISQPEEYKKPPNLYVPSYTYTGAVTPTPPRAVTKNQNSKQSEQPRKIEKNIPTAKNGILPKSMLLASYNV